MKKNFNYKEAYTHAGSFHADDVMSAALLKLIANKLNSVIEINRVFCVDKVPEGALVFDIGGGEYDHHQPDALVRENGNKYAAFGLLWRDFGYILCEDDEVVQAIDEYFIQPMDLADNFGDYNPISGIISNFNYTWIETEKISSNTMKFCVDIQFNKTVEIFIPILKRVIESQNAIYMVKKQVLEVFKESIDKEIIILEKAMPWKEALIPSTAKFVVYPSNRGGWNAQVVPINKDTTEAKVDFLKEWAGLRNEELQKVSGIDDLVFCHSSLFLCASNTKEGAINACKKALGTY